MAYDLTGLPSPYETLSGNERVFVSVFICSGFIIFEDLGISESSC